MPGLPDLDRLLSYRFKGAISSLGLQQVEDQCFNVGGAFCNQQGITTANGVNQSATNAGAVNTPSALVAVASEAFNAATETTDGFDSGVQLSVRSAGL